MAGSSGKKRTANNSSEAEVVFADSGSKADYRRRKKALDTGQLRKIAPKIYTSNRTDSAAAILRRNWRQVLGHLYHNAIVSHRTAMELKPSDEGYVHLTYTYTKKRKLPGLTIFLTDGPPKKDDDGILPGGLILASEARKALENLERHAKKTRKTVNKEQLEQWLEILLNARGEAGLNELRDRARQIAGRHWAVEYKKLDNIIGALLRTKSASVLVSDSARRRSRGMPYDNGRDRLFDNLFTYLMREPVSFLAAKPSTLKQREAFAFFESYFSNFIEGTEFEIKEAEEIIFERKIPAARSRDGHDILELYILASDVKEMKRIPQDPVSFVEIVKRRHQRLLAARPEKRPGQFKERPNRAGDTHFVDPSLVNGTLAKGFEYVQALPTGFARAVFMMFLVSEVHPFDDGNGRIARLMMNAELSHDKTHRLLVPIVYRLDYLTALRKLSRQSDPSVYVKMLERLYRFSSRLSYSGVENLEAQLSTCNAFKEPEGHTLKMP